MTYLLMGLLTLAAMLLLTRPWWGRARAQRMQRRAANIAAYRTRLGEIASDVDAGILAADQVETMQQESAARLLADAQVPATLSQHRSGWRLAVALALLLPALAAFWYWRGESWHLQQDITLAAEHPEQAQSLMIQSMVQRLERRLKDSPDDAEGWAMLGRSYFVMQRYVDAASAYQRANRLNNGQSAETLVGEGEALAMAHDRDLTGRPEKLFDAALKLEPDNGKALWYAGLAAAQSGAYAKAQTDWLKLRDQDLPPDLSQALDARLKELSSLSGLPLPQKKAMHSADTGVARTGVTLHVQVSLAADLARKIPSDATLFVFAKAASGPPMPLAVRKFAPGQWSLKQPLDVELNDGMAMMPQLRLSLFKQWRVSARISRSGNVQTSPGDLEGQVEVSQDEAGRPVHLVISDVVDGATR